MSSRFNYRYPIRGRKRRYYELQAAEPMRFNYRYPIRGRKLPYSVGIVGNTRRDLIVGATFRVGKEGEVGIVGNTRRDLITVTP